MKDFFEQLHLTAISGNATADGLLFEIHEQLRKKGNVARGALIALDASAKDPVAVIQRRYPQTKVVWSAKAGTLIELTRKVKTEGEESRITGQALILPTSLPSVFMAITFGGSTFTSRVLLPVIERGNPTIFLPRITSKSVASVLHRAHKTETVSFEMKELAVRSRIENKRGKRVRSERMWTGESLEDVLTTLKERGQWIHSAAFLYSLTTDKKRRKCLGRISRTCNFKVSGDFTWFYKNILMAAGEEVVSTIRFLSNRARSETPESAPRPIIIQYADPIFEDKAKHQKLSQSLKRFKRASVSVLHANPYFRATLVDFGDGSSYEVWVLSETRVIVTPQFRATSASLERVIDHILTDFGEGELKDFGEVYSE